MSIKNLSKKRETNTEKFWIYFFQIIGGIMFLAGIWESLITLFWLNKDVVTMNSFRVGFAACGFVLAMSGKQLGVLANNLGIVIINKFK